MRFGQMVQLLIMVIINHYKILNKDFNYKLLSMLLYFGNGLNIYIISLLTRGMQEEQRE